MEGDRHEESSDRDIPIDAFPVDVMRSIQGGNANSARQRGVHRKVGIKVWVHN